MRARALIHVQGPAGAGKTTFIERLLEAEVAFTICIRAQRDAKLRKEQASAPKTHAELGRYRAAGASDAALYRFAAPNAEAFFSAEVMQDYSEAVFIEGDCPLDYVDLSVFVARPPERECPLLRRVVRDHASSHRAALARFAHALETPEAFARLLGAELGEPLGNMARKQSGLLGPDDLRHSLESKLAEARRAPPPLPTEHWALAEGYTGIERAQLVIVNVRTDADRRAAASVIEDVARLRKDEEVHRDVLGPLGNKIPVTAVIADLSNPKDAGLKKAVARVKRAAKRRFP